MQKQKVNEMLIPASIIIAGAIFSGTVMLSNRVSTGNGTDIQPSVSTGGTTQRSSGASCGV